MPLLKAASEEVVLGATDNTSGGKQDPPSYKCSDPKILIRGFLNPAKLIKLDLHRRTLTVTDGKSSLLPLIMAIARCFGTRRLTPLTNARSLVDLLQNRWVSYRM